MPNCKDWKENKNINPYTNRVISKDLPVYKNLEKICTETGKVCKDFKNEPKYNPLTGNKLNNEQLRKLITDICNEYDEELQKNTKDAEIFQGVCMIDENRLSCTEYETVKLKDHQNKVCKYIAKNDPLGLLLFHSVGSGKTITSITVIRCILEKNPDIKVFVITPTSLVDNFKKELEKVKINFPDNVKIYSHGIFINKIKKNGTEFCKDSVIIIDEAHHFKTKIKGVNGKQTKILMRATSRAKQVFLLTATPIQNKFEEFANLYAMINNEEDNLPYLYDIFSNGSESTLKKMLHNKISYFKNKDTEDYPSVTNSDIDFYMTKKYYELYKHVEENNLDMFSDRFGNSRDLIVFLNGIRRAVNNIDDNVPTPKIIWAVKHLRKSNKSGKKVLVYSNWLKSGTKLIQDKLDHENIEYSVVNGSMTASERQKAVNKYNSNKTNILFVSSAGAEGLDLKETRSVIILEPHWNNEKLRQVIGRAVRYKSHSTLPPNQRHVDIYNLILRKPKKNRGKDTRESADVLLQNISSEKEIKIDKFYELLIDSSI
jgi:SNF2 family DNA or RNA helicase